ncbi:protein spitz-like [Culex pipiens pallens]|uniref:protein spitz-like n=1 Tax=Culex pipiens pallens TaxID=42434 RepID=UPI0019549BAC|nr:protein spitz-like [Culex pipiens pallens]
MNRNIVKFYATLFIMLSSVVLITDCCSSRSMPKSRPRPVSHFRGVITTSSAKITTTTGSHGNLNLNGGDGGQQQQQMPDSATATFTLITTKTAIVTGSGPTSTVTDPRSGPGPGGTTSSSSSDQRQNQPPQPNKDQLMRMGKCSLLFEENYCLNGGKCYNFTIANSTMPTCECADGFMGERCESKYLDGTYLSMRKSKIHIETASIYYGAFLALIAVLVLLYFLHCFQAGAAAASAVSSASGSKQLLLKKSKKVVS